MEKFKATLSYLGGNPRSDDRMTAALWCRSSLGGVILGGTRVIEGPKDGFFGGAVLHPTHSWRWTLTAWRSAVLGFAVGGWTRAGGRRCRASWWRRWQRELAHGTCNNTALKMVWWQVAAASSYPAGVLVEEYAGLVGAHTRQTSWLGPQVLDDRFG